MYYANQIIYDLDKKKLHELKPTESVFAWDPKQYPKHHTHLVFTDKAKGHRVGDIYCCEGGMVGAAYLFERGEITPFPTARYDTLGD